jgi:hypothetical protein
VIVINGGNIKSLSTTEPSRIANEANKHKIMVTGDSHLRGLVRNVNDY